MAINNNQNLSKFAGCLLGGAVGDALGAPVEFKTTDAIRDIDKILTVLDKFSSYDTTMMQ
jgi:ADP-ribosylglycohydrolase